MSCPCENFYIYLFIICITWISLLCAEEKSMKINVLANRRARNHGPKDQLSCYKAGNVCYNFQGSEQCKQTQTGASILLKGLSL
jgi:hypothetical protein